jgi:hypothetical protein
MSSSHLVEKTSQLLECIERLYFIRDPGMLAPIIGLTTGFRRERPFFEGFG